jgi:hypothetical protein
MNNHESKYRMSLLDVQIIMAIVPLFDKVGRRTLQTYTPLHSARQPNKDHKMPVGDDPSAGSMVNRTPIDRAQIAIGI